MRSTAPTRTSGRQSQTPAKFRHDGGFGAAAGPGFSSRPALPGIHGSLPPRGRTTATVTSGNAGRPTSSRGANAAAVDDAASSSLPSTPSARAAEIMSMDFGPCDETIDVAGARGPPADGRFSLSKAGHDERANDTPDDDDDSDFGLGSAGLCTAKVAAKGAGAGREKSISRNNGPSTEEISKKAASIMTLRKSIVRNKDKPYELWPVSLLQHACTKRKISRQSKERDAKKLASVLTGVDKVIGRTSPYVEDLNDEAAGGTPASNPPATAAEACTPPPDLVLALRAAIQGGLNPDKDKMFNGSDGKSYTTAAIMSVIDAEDAASGKGSTVANRKKSKHCIPRLAELMIDERFRTAIAASRTQLSKMELDQKQTGKKRTVNLALWEAFKDSNVKVVESLRDDSVIVAAGIDPNVVHQPEISFDKFINMLRDVNKDFSDCDRNMNKSGSHEEWYSFCKGGTDVYYYGKVLRMHPEVVAVCSQLLPEELQRENTGVVGGADSDGGAKAAAADSERRNAAKRTAREANGHLDDGVKKAKKQEKHMQKAASIALGAVTEGLGLQDGLGALFNTGAAPGPPLKDVPHSWLETKEGVESRAARLEFSNSLLDALEKAEARLEAAKDKGSSAKIIEILQRKVEKIEKALEKDAEEDV